MVVHLGEQVIVIVIVVIHFGEQGGSVLDLGSGPSIASIIAASRFLLTGCQGAIHAFYV